MGTTAAASSRRLVRRCCTPNVGWSKALGCLPLAAAGLAISGYYAALGSWEVVYSVTSDSWVDLLSGWVLGMACLKLGWAAWSFVAVLSRVQPLMFVAVAGNRMMILTSLVSVALIWAEFGRDMGRGWRPDNVDVVRLTFHTSAYVIIFVFCLWQASVLASLRMIQRVGGTGWEFENYREFTILNVIIDQQVDGAHDGREWTSAAVSPNKLSGGGPVAKTAAPSECTGSDTSFEAVAITPLSHHPFDDGPDPGGPPADDFAAGGRSEQLPTALAPRRDPPAAKISAADQGCDDSSV